ncbi:MAG: hypothetical protein IJS69_01015 [Selenomonadaceae bacterium]|nr:hypothetical protein [Selenomonadaceae bacterium]
MSQKFYIVWSVIYLILMAIMICGFGAVSSWLDLFTGFVIGVTVMNLLRIYEQHKRGKRQLR